MPSIAALRRILLPGDMGDMGDEGEEGVGPFALELGSWSSASTEGTPGMQPGGETLIRSATCCAFIARRLRKGCGEIGEVGIPHRRCKAAKGEDTDLHSGGGTATAATAATVPGMGSSKASLELAALGIAMARRGSPQAQSTPEACQIGRAHV